MESDGFDRQYEVVSVEVAEQAFCNKIVIEWMIGQGCKCKVCKRLDYIGHSNFRTV